MERQKTPRVVALGDSLTEGFPFGPGVSWVEYLRDKGLDIVNKGCNGETTGEMLYRLDRDVIALSPDYAIITGGANDVFTGVPVAAIMDNYREMVRRLEAVGTRAVLGLTLPVDHPDLEEQLGKLRAYLRDLAREHNLCVIDFYNALVDPATGMIKTEFDFDGVHPNGEGYRVMGIAAWEALREVL